MGKAAGLLSKVAVGSAKMTLKVGHSFYTKMTIPYFSSIHFQASNAAMLAQLLPLLPPVVIGLYVLFAAFWPQRILFFSSKQRRKTMNDQGGKWTD